MKMLWGLQSCVLCCFSANVLESPVNRETDFGFFFFFFLQFLKGILFSPSHNLELMTKVQEEPVL